MPQTVNPPPSVGGAWFWRLTIREAQDTKGNKLVNNQEPSFDPKRVRRFQGKDCGCYPLPRYDDMAVEGSVEDSGSSSSDASSGSA